MLEGFVLATDRFTVDAGLLLVRHFSATMHVVTG
jgi:hypothetical protein